MGFLIETSELAEARRILGERRALSGAIRISVAERLTAEWEAAGGCETCRGRGWIVTWDTMDSLSGCYAEYGGCPAEGCTEETRAATGLKPGGNKYDGIRRVKLVEPMEHATPVEAAAHESMEAEIEAAEGDLLEAEAGAYCAKGAHVRVVRGRKVPRGTEGVVIWSGKDKFRGAPRVGIKDRKEEVHWTAGANLELIEAASGYLTPEGGDARNAYYGGPAR